MILKITRGEILYEYKGKFISIPGEALLPGYGSPDFVVFSKMVKYWDPPNENVSINDTLRTEIFKALVEEMKSQGMTVEIE